MKSSVILFKELNGIKPATFQGSPFAKFLSGEWVNAKTTDCREYRHYLHLLWYWLNQISDVIIAQLQLWMKTFNEVAKNNLKNLITCQILLGKAKCIQ